MCSGALRGSKSVSEHLEPKLQAVVHAWTWVLGMDLGSSARAGSTLNPEPLLQPDFASFIDFKHFSLLNFHTLLNYIQMPFAKKEKLSWLNDFWV